MCADVYLSQECCSRFVLLYRSPSPSVPQAECLANIKTIVTFLQQNTAEKVILLGDFNIDILKLPISPLQRLLKGFGFKQIVTEPTHRSGSCLDHAYLSDTSFGLVSVLPTYYSDHYFVHTQILS